MQVRRGESDFIRDVGQAAGALAEVEGDQDFLGGSADGQVEGPGERVKPGLEAETVFFVVAACPAASPDVPVAAEPADVRGAAVVLGANRDDLAHALAAVLIWLAVLVPVGRCPQVQPPAVRRGDQGVKPQGYFLDRRQSVTPSPPRAVITEAGGAFGAFRTFHTEEGH